MYHDTAILWKHKVKHSGESMYEGAICVDSEISSLVSKYKLVTERDPNCDPLGKSEVILVDNSMKLPLADAQDRLEQATATLHQK